MTHNIQTGSASGYWKYDTLLDFFFCYDKIDYQLEIKEKLEDAYNDAKSMRCVPRGTLFFNHQQQLN